MKYLIRFITRNAAGGVEHSNKVIDAPAITIGRATDQVLHLKDRRARLQHARIEPQNGDVHITTDALSGVTVNGQSQRDVRLATGDVIEVGSNVLRVIDPPSDVDFAITFELHGDASSEHLESSWTAATGFGGWSKRRLSWTLAGAVLVFAFIVPLLSALYPSVAAVMRGSTMLPNDGWWMAGPLHSAHSSLNDSCESCHTIFFQRVQDDACQACHAADRHVNDPEPMVLGEVRCASCHLEHNEPPQLIKQHQGLCADCHRNLPDTVALENAEDFLDAHPGFKVSFLRPVETTEGTTEWTLEHVLLADAQGADNSNLKFNHKVHLDKAGIVTPDGRRVVECAECHKPEPGGARMQAIKMDENCVGCHALSFDPDDPSRQVPHGDAEAVVQALIEYYSAKLLGADPDAVEQRLRRPGQALTRQDRDRAAAEARVQAMQVAEDLFERQTCANCHTVTRIGGNSKFPWQVKPVRLTKSFFPQANFSHASHDTEATSCNGCHQAGASESARDLLMPDIATCRECHGSGSEKRNAPEQIPSSCIMCHSFHFPTKGAYRPDETNAAGAIQSGGTIRSDTINSESTN